jgi:hypothetical protein
MSERWWETGGSPPMKPRQKIHNPAGFWMNPDLEIAIKIVLGILFTILCFAFFGFGGATVGLLIAVFLTKPTSALHRW